MAEVLVLVDHEDGQVRRPALELLRLARRLGSPSSVFIGSPERFDDAVRHLSAYGADKVYVIDDAHVRNALVAPAAETLAQLVEIASPAAVLLTSSADGREVAARLSIKLGSGLITDAVDVAADGTVSKTVFAGAFTVLARVTRGVPVITVRPSSVEPETVQGAGVSIAFAPRVSPGSCSARVVTTLPRERSNRPELAEASIVVSGGRGVGSSDGFAIIERLADVLGAAVGASRAAVDAGWRPHSFQVGQTGKSVSPALYMANGISGAIQHRAGMQTSKTIVAVNKDPEAPIFELADLGVVGDLHAVLPALIEQIEQRRS